MAPATFDAKGNYARVYAQPDTDDDVTAALKALVACPTGSIGDDAKRPLRDIVAGFPDEITDGVYHCGFHSEDSFGAASYLVVRADGNVLVDSPRFTKSLVANIERLGGVATMFLTHRDDVADHEKFRDHFGCERVMHAADVHSNTRGVERKLRGDDPVELADDLVVIPTPGHTRGSACLLYRNEVLLSGDHVAYSRGLGHVYAFAGACWYDWDVQIESMERLAEYEFDRILPGHSAPCAFPKPVMRAQMQTCIEWMRTR